MSNDFQTICNFDINNIERDEELQARVKIDLITVHIFFAK